MGRGCSREFRPRVRLLSPAERPGLRSPRPVASASSKEPQTTAARGGRPFPRVLHNRCRPLPADHRMHSRKQCRLRRRKSAPCDLSLCRGRTNAASKLLNARDTTIIVQLLRSFQGCGIPVTVLSPSDITSSMADLIKISQAPFTIRPTASTARCAICGSPTARSSRRRAIRPRGRPRDRRHAAWSSCPAASTCTATSPGRR